MILRTSKPKRSGLNFNYYERTKDIADNATIVRLYDTIVLIAERNYIKLNSGGFKTNHTKNVINDFLPCDYVLYQKKGEWFIDTPKGTLEFTDNIIIEM